MRTRLNLATAPIENNRPFIVGAGLLGGLALFALAGLSVHAYRGWQANRKLRADISRFESQIHDLAERQQSLQAFFKQPQTAQVIDRSAFFNSLIQQRSFPWTQVFMDLEQSLPSGVRVVSIAPRMQNGRVEIHLVVGATSDEGKVRFLKALENSKAFSGVQVRQETHPRQAAGSADQVLLELVAWYATT